MAIVTSLSFTIDPKVGSIAGGTWITISFNGCNLHHLHRVRFGNGSHLEVDMINPLMPPISCDVKPLFSTLSTIKCQTRSSQQEAVYKLDVLVNGQAINQSPDSFFKYSAAQTPEIDRVQPSLGIPGCIIEVSGWIKAEISESYDFNVDYIDGPIIMESEGDQSITICSLVNKDTKSLYPIQVENGYGKLQCRVEGNYIGSQNISFSVFNKGKSTVDKEAWLVNAKQELFMFQTHSEIFSVTPDCGSKAGGTDITIVGHFFHVPAQVSIAGVPCKISHVSPNVIMCTTGPNSDRQTTPHPGNRGLLFERWNGSTTMDGRDLEAGYKALWVPNGSSRLDTIFGFNHSFSARLSGFFVAPETNNYTFWIQADNEASLFFCILDNIDTKVKIASIPQGMSTWSDHWEKDWDERWQQKSPKMELVQGRKYFLEMFQHGSRPNSEMRIGVQIHNTWLGPDVVNTYQREKHQIVAHSTRLPDVQMLTLSGEGLVGFCWGNVSSKLIFSNSTAAQIQAAIEDMLSVHCVTEISDVDIFLQDGFEEGMNNLGTEGKKTSWTEPYCGRVSILNPKYLVTSSQLEKAYELNKYTHVCFAYKGYMEESLIVSFSYYNTLQHTVRKNYTCPWKYNESSPESWKLSCTDLWHCVNGSDSLQDLHMGSAVYVDQIVLKTQETEDEENNWFYVDEVIVANGSIKVLPIDPEPARPGGHLIEAVNVTGSYPIYNVTSLVANCGLNLPLIQLCGASMGTRRDAYLSQSLTSGNEIITLTVQRIQSATPPIGGTFSVHLLETVIPGIPVYISSLNLRELLIRNTDNYTAQYINVSDFTVTKDLNTCYHVVWTLTWTHLTGDLPNIINVQAENLTGVDPYVKSRVIFDGGVLLWPIFGDMLATANTQPQVIVHVNDIPAKCSGSCSFQYLQEWTPVVTGLQYSSEIGCDLRVDITGYGFMNSSEEDLDIRINQTNCNIIYVNASSISCCLEEVLSLGEHQVKVHLKPQGLAINSTGSNIYLHVTPRISSVSPTVIPQIGGQLVTIRGITFDQPTLVFFGSHPCQVTVSNPTTIKCVAPAQDDHVYEVDIKMKICEQWVTFPNGITYDPALNPVIVSITPNISGVAGDRPIYIEMSQFDRNASLDITVLVEKVTATIKSLTYQGIKVFLPQLPIGSYNISVTINGIHIQAIRSKPSIQYTLETFNVEPGCGSFFGGTIITVFGNGFSTNSSLISVIIGTQPCDIVKSTEKEISCRTPPFHSLNTDQQSVLVLVNVYILNYSALHIDAMHSNRSNLTFTYHKDVTPKVSNISWVIEEGNITFQVTGFDVTNSHIELKGLECKLKYNEELANASCQIPFTDFEVGQYPIQIYSQQMGYANITSNLATFRVVPHVYSISPGQSPLCGGTVLTISGSNFKSANNTVLVNISSDYICPILSFNKTTIECVIQVKRTLTLNSTCLNLTVTVNGITGTCREDCSFQMLDEWTPLVDEVEPKWYGSSWVLHILGSRLNISQAKLIIMVDNSRTCNLTIWNATMAECKLYNILPGNHTVEVLSAGRGHMCLPRNSFHFFINPRVSRFYPDYFGIYGGGLLTIEGPTIQGNNTTRIFFESNLCNITTISSSMIKCIVPPGNGIMNLRLQIDIFYFNIGQIQCQEQYTPVIHSSLQSDLNILILIVSNISTVRNVHIYVADSNCTNVSGNTSILQCCVPQLPVGNYHIKFLDVQRGWASSNATLTTSLVVTSLRNNFGCMERKMLHINGVGFSPGHTAVSICGTPCEIFDNLTTPTDIYCFNWQLNSSLSFLCDLTYDAGEHCYRGHDTYIQCDVTVRVGSVQLRQPLAYYHVCDERKCDAWFGQDKNGTGPPINISGLFISPKVERDEVLIYNSSCDIAMETEAEMECQAPNQPITAKITEIWKNRGQNTQKFLLNFCSLWSKKSSWFSGHLPLDGDNVTVDRGHTLLLDTNTSLLNLLHVRGGKLQVIGPGPVHLHAHYIIVSDGGELQVGTATEPFPGKVQITLYGSSFTPSLYPYGMKFLAVRNASLSMHGWVPQVTSTHLALNAQSNDTILVLTEAVDWRVGDEAVICGVGPGGSTMHEETFTIENVNKKNISTRRPLRYSYEILEQFIENRSLSLRPTVALLSRNIVVEGNCTNPHKQFKQAGVSDISKCLCDTSENKLRSPYLGTVLIVEALQNEPSQLHISGIQFRHTGQVYRKQLSALNIAGDIFMTGSYIRGCTVVNSFARGLSISGISEFIVENNIFYNIKGHCFLVGEHLEEAIKIKNNLMISISGTDGLSSIEMLAPAAVYIRSPSTIIEGNTVWSAGYGFLYHLTNDGPSQASLQSFKDNTAVLCTRSGFWLHPEYDASSHDTAALFQGFTAWSSRGGAQISRCGNVSFREFNIYFCDDFGIHITESNGSLEIDNSLFLGRLDGKEDGCMKTGIKTPRRFQQVLISNTTFVNFDLKTCSAISTCSGCYRGQGGFTVQTQRLKFINSPNRATFQFPFSAMIEDKDGSLSDLKGSHLLASDLLPESCKKSSHITGTIPGSVCGRDVVFHRMSMGLERVPDVGYNLTNNMNKTSVVNYVHDTLSHLYGWMVLLVDKELYTLQFDTMGMSHELQYSATFDNFHNGNYILMEHRNLSRLLDFAIRCDSKVGKPLQSLPIPGTSNPCDWYFDSSRGTLTYLVAGEGRISVTLSAEEKMAMPTAVPSGLPHSIFKWSSPESWRGVEMGWGGHNSSIPKAGDDVIILPNRTIVVDIALPPLRGLYVLGTLELPTDSSNVLSVTCIIIAGGEVRVGTSEHPLEREQTLQILLRSSEQVPCDRLNFLNVSSGEIGVFGKLQIHSAYPSKSWTRLGADIAPGNEMIVLEDPVDWKPGHKVVISSSSYEAHQAELVQLREVHGHTIRILENVIYRHTGAIYNIADTWRIPLSAEVGLLSRNVQINTDHECSGRIVVGQCTNTNGEQYAGSLHLWNVEISNFGSSPFSAINFINTSLGSSIISSSIHHSCGGGVEASNSINILLHANTIFNVVGHGIYVDLGQNHTLTDNLLVLIKQPKEKADWVTGIKMNLVEGASLYRNAVAGSERIAYHVRGQKCCPEERLWSGNVAHSSLHGVHYYWDDGFQNCTKLTGFLSYKNYDYGLIFHLRSSVVVENMILIDNTVGLLPVVSELSSNYMKREIVLYNSLLVATSPAFDCLMDRIKPFTTVFTARDRAPQCPFRGRVGILWPAFTDEPNQWPIYPWHKLGSNGALSGIMKLQDVTFFGFRKSCYSDDGDIAIMSNPENLGIMSPVTAERTRMLHIRPQNMLYFHSTLSAPQCPLCYGTRKALFKDLDGISLGLTAPITVFPKSGPESWNSCFNTGIYTKENLCTYRSELQGFICQQIDHTVVILDIIGNSTQAISPVSSITGNFIDIFVNGNISQDQCCYVKDHSRFYNILPASKITKVCFNGPTPKAMRLQLNGGQNTTKIILALFYDSPQSFYVTSRGKIMTPTLLVTEPAFASEMHGSSFFIFAKNLLYVILQGDEPVEIWTNLSMHLIFYVARGTDVNIYSQLPLKLSNYLGIHQSQVTILQTLKGTAEALRAMTDNHAKRHLHCHSVLSVRDEKPHSRYKRSTERNEQYSYRPSSEKPENQLHAIVVEISNQASSVDTTSGFEHFLPLTYDKLQWVASNIINELQTGALEKLLPMNIDSLMVIKQVQTGIRNSTRAETEDLVYVRPYRIHIQQQPSNGSMGKPLSVQPKVIFFDIQGNRVANVGHPLNPWILSVHLKDALSTDLKGSTSIVIQGGWGNFSDLAISISGSNLCLIFNVTSPSGVMFTAQSREFQVVPVTSGDTEYIVMLVLLSSAAYVIALFLFLCCFFKRKKVEKLKTGKRK
ncbi:fibrocystin [Discoglossus pictus]